MKVDVNQIPLTDQRLIGATFLSAVRAFYNIPENVEKFEKWKESRNKKEE